MELSQHIYRVVFENDVVRMLEATFHPGDRIARHRHPDQVSYVVTGGRLRIAMNDLPARDVDVEDGEALPFFALEHTVENIGKTDVKVVVLEIRSRARTPTMPGRDAIAAAPEAYKTVFENDRLRVLEADFPKGAKAAPHVHPDHAIYVLTPGKLRVTSGVLPFHDFTLTAGEGIFLKSYGHAVENIGRTEVKLVVFELR